MGKKELEDGCTFIDTKCVPTSVLQWITLLESIDSIESLLQQAVSTEETIQTKKESLHTMLDRLVSL